MDWRVAKKQKEAERLRDLPVATRMRMGFELMEFGRRLRQAAALARR